MNINKEELNQVQIDLHGFVTLLTSITLRCSGGISSHGEVTIAMQASRDLISAVLDILQGRDVLSDLNSFKSHMKALNFSMPELKPFWVKLGVESEVIEELYAAFDALAESEQALGAVPPDALSASDFAQARVEVGV